MDPNFDKDKVCKEFGISKTCLYKILREKDTIISMNVVVFDISKLKISENIHDLVYWENILSYDFLVGKVNMQNSAKPAIAQKNWMTKLCAIAGYRFLTKVQAGQKQSLRKRTSQKKLLCIKKWKGTKKESKCKAVHWVNDLSSEGNQ